MARKQILVVEDNEKNMKLFRDVLTATGYDEPEAPARGHLQEGETGHRPVTVDAYPPARFSGAQLRRSEGLHGPQAIRQDGGPRCAGG